MSQARSTDAEHDALLEKLRPRLSDEFLATLKDAADLTLCDSMEVDAFVAEVFHWAGKEVEGNEKV